MKNSTPHLLATMAVIALPVLPHTAAAVGPWSWATETAMARFTPEDLELLREAGREAIQSGSGEYTSTWNNPASGHSGTVTVYPVSKAGTQNCREARLENDAGTIKGTAQYTLCEQADGSWKITYPQ